jgi:pyruvate dehydrogenase E1 component alpha subunit
MAELFAKETGLSKGRGSSMHMFDKENHFYGGHGIVGGQVPLGAGIAFAEQYRGTDLLNITYLGDGAARQGAFHEALNLAMTMKLPMIIVIENNGYAMGTSVSRTSNVTDLSQLGAAYEMPSEAVDAMNVENVHNAVTRAAARARKGDGPTLLEFRTYRYKGHSMSDPAKYRTKEEVAEYKELDPIEQVRATILKNKFATEAALTKIEDKIKQTVTDAVKFAEESDYPKAEDAFEYVYMQEDYPFEKG